jgi:hypothetical protein
MFSTIHSLLLCSWSITKQCGGQSYVFKLNHGCLFHFPFCASYLHADCIKQQSRVFLPKQSFNSNVLVIPYPYVNGDVSGPQRAERALPVLPRRYETRWTPWWTDCAVGLWIVPHTHEMSRTVENRGSLGDWSRLVRSSYYSKMMSLSSTIFP